VGVTGGYAALGMSFLILAQLFHAWELRRNW